MATTTITTRTEEVRLADVKVGDLLARMHPSGRGGYCSPSQSFYVVEVIPGATADAVRIRYEHPETGEILDDGPGYPGSTTTRVIGVVAS